MTLRRFILAAALPAVLTALVGGCQDDTARRIELRDELIAAQNQVEDLQEENLDLRQQITAQQQAIQDLRQLGQDRLEHLFVVDKIELGNYTAAANLDDKPGDDGVRVRFTPHDKYGSPLKAAGSIRIQLFDLTEAGEKPLIGQCKVPVEQAADHWAGHFGQYHYTTSCAWDRPPQKDELTVRVEFVDYLTGKAFSAQKVVKVSPPPAE